ncbi:CAMK/CAMKL/MARK protein kinase [Lentinula raphanica]|nr:CAMK/CAMKL/MARK protein kinase [Lentinula raphanica]
MEPLSSNDNTTDVFSFQDDEELSNRLQFVKEIGCGNWGSVWLCELKGEDRVHKRPLATKLVHRNKESKTSAARVKSLWNEMKIIRRLKSDPHPSIIKFESFLLTPSYAIITMAYHPDLVTVQVSESHARVWFKHLLSAVQFLHSRGIVHNDIKPANILLSAKGIPVLCDFGFAEAYDLSSSAAFHSRFAYGTPEYLAPERARGIPHDTRKSDIWSLGVSFFEILIGRTPFENSDTDQCITEEDLQKYWGRTLRGKWVGVWKMSKGMERLLKRMLSPNADLRCTADEAIKDIYWAQVQQAHQVTEHRRSASYTSSIVFEKDWSKLSETREKTQIPSPLANHTTRQEDANEKEAVKPKNAGLHSPPGLESPRKHGARPLTKSKSQGKMMADVSKNPPRKRIGAHVDLSPIKASPPVSPQVQSRKANASSNVNTRPAPRAPFGVLQSRNVENLPAAPQRRLAGKPSIQDLTKRHSKVGMLDELVNGPPGARKAQNKGWKGKENHVSQRVRDWEREKERLREISRLEEIEREGDAKFSDSSDTDEPEVVDITPELEQVKASDKVTTSEAVSTSGVAPGSSAHPSGSRMNNSYNKTIPIFSEPSTPAATFNSTFLPEVIVSPTSPNKSSQLHGTATRPTSSSGRANFKHAIKRSIDKTFQMYKTSSLTGKSYHSRNLSVDQQTDAESRGTHSERESWEDEDCVRAVKSSLPVVKHAVHNEQIAADNRVDRLTLWMRNVEQVVEDARQNFSSGKETPLPPLPLPPANRSNLSASQNRSNRSSRLPRRVLAANQIFSESGDQSAEMSSFVTSVYASPGTSGSAGNPGNTNAIPDLSVSQLQTPSRQRRATVSTRSPDPVVSGPIDSCFDNDHGSPSKRKEKSKSHGNLFQLHIAPAAALGAELDKRATASSPSFDMLNTPRLSALVDREVFIAPPVRSSENLGLSVSSSPSSQSNDKSCDELTSSPLRVEPYAPRPTTHPIPDTPTQKRVEGVYDRFLMATSGVKRLGKGYQSDNIGPVHHTVSHTNPIKQNHRAFYSVRKPLQMPPAVASDDQPQALTVDELGIIGYSTAEGSTGVTVLKDESNATVALVRRAFKAIVPGKTNRRLSRIN